MTVVLYLFVAIVLVAAIKAAYWFAITRLLPGEVLADEVHTVTTKDSWSIKLFRYRPKDGEPGEPVFIVHGFAANHWNAALPRHESLVDTLTARGYDCWVVDLRGNRTSVPPAGVRRHEATFDGYVLGDIPSALAFVRKETGCDKVHWIGHSMGGLLLHAYEAVHGPEEFASGTTLGTPPGFKGVAIARQKRILSFVRKYPVIAEMYLRALAPLVPIFRPGTTLLPINWNNMSDEFGPRAWFDIAELPPTSVAETLIDTAVFHFLGVKENSIDVLSKLKELRTPLFVVHGVRDPLATVENVRSFYDALPSQDKRRLELSLANGHSADYDHIDVAFATNGVEEVFEPIAEWIEAHRVKYASRTVERRQAQPEVPVPEPVIVETKAAEAEPAEEEAEEEAPVELSIVPHTTSNRKRATLWGSALKNAAEVMTDLDGDSGTDSGPEKSKDSEIIQFTPKAKAPTSKRKVVNKKAAAKKATAKKPAAKKKGQTKAAKKKPAKKKAVKKSAAKKKAAAKKKPVKKKAASKKPAVAKKPAKKKVVKKNPAKKKSVKKAATKKKTAAKKKR